MKVNMLKSTYYTIPRIEGKEYSDIPEDVAKRWERNGIAEIVINDDKEEQTVSYEDMSAKQLFALCKERKIEVEPKQTSEFYIEKLQEYDAALEQ